MLSDYFMIGIKNIKNRFLRAGLTILGIVIGVAAIIALVSVGEGLDYSINKAFESFGTQRIFIFASGAAGSDPSSRTGLSSDDVDVLERMSYFEFVTPYYSAGGEVKFGKESEFASYVYGFPPDRSDERFAAYGMKLDKGRFFSSQDTAVTVIGSRVPTDFYDKEVRLGSSLTIRDKKFKVVGILESLGSPEDDTVIYIPLDTAREVFDADDQVSMIDAQIKAGTDVPLVAAEVERRLEQSRGDDLFEVQTAEQLLEQTGQILIAVQLVLMGIAGISLFVGGLGIMNSMYTSVLERTREIGIMKAIGATNRDIVIVFMLEAGTISAIGGFIGAVLGSLMGLLVESGAAAAGYTFLKVPFNPWLVVFGIIFAFVVGILSGILPARSAVQKSVVDSLRQ